MTTRGLLWAILIVFLVILLVHIPFLFYTGKHPRVVIEKVLEEEPVRAYWQIAYPNYWEWPTGWYGSPWYYGGGGGTYSGGIRTHGAHGGYGAHNGHGGNSGHGHH